MAYFALAVANKGNDSKFFFLVLTAIPSHEKSSIRYFRKVGRYKLYKLDLLYKLFHTL